MMGGWWLLADRLLRILRSRLETYLFVLKVQNVNNHMIFFPSSFVKVLEEC
jgi:hypothetical protein